MREIRLSLSDTVIVTPEIENDYTTNYLCKRYLTVLAPLIVFGVLFCLWSYSPISTTVVVTYIARFELTKALERQQLERCINRYDHRLLWTTDSSGFVEPPCHVVFEDDSDLADQAEAWTPKNAYDDRSVFELISNCSVLKRSANFPDKPNSIEEAEYPLAYVITSQENTVQTLRFLRNIYWPHNSYCFALAPNASNLYRSALYALTKCFDKNVFIAGGLQQENLPPAQNRYAFLKNIVDCFRLLTSNRTDDQKWKYVQIVSSDDFPLKTNLQLVNILPLLNGGNDCPLQKERASEYVFDKNVSGNNRSSKTVPPGGLFLFRGHIESTLSYEFVDFLLTNTLSKQFLDWLNGTSAPELYYWSTLNHNILLDPPGGFPGPCIWFYNIRREKKMTVSRTKIWENEYMEERLHCKNLDGFDEIDQTACKAEVTDVAWYMQQPQLMGHRFDAEREPAALYCLEKWHWTKVCQKTVDVENAFYENLQASLYANLSAKEEFLC